MALYQLTIAYDGTLFLGFQKQREGRTVQGEIERALTTVGWSDSSVLASGRTDSGVHASGQVITFHLDWPHSEMNLQKAINSHLPDDIVIRDLKIALEGFHPRFSAIARRYVYRIYCGEYRNPIIDRFSWRVWPDVKFELLQEAAKILVGEHNFSAFGKPPKEEAGTIRTIFSSKWVKEKAEFRYEVRANAFLYHMVRRAVFLQVRIGQGKLSMEAMKQAVNGEIGIKPGIAPACGLDLAEVEY